MMYVQVNIGRNIGSAPMDDGMWDRFITAVSDAVWRATDDRATENPEVHKGVGTWNGVREESAHVSILADIVYAHAIKRDLKELRDRYMQDHIALIITQSELV